MFIIDRFFKKAIDNFIKNFKSALLNLQKSLYLSKFYMDNFIRL